MTRERKQKQGGRPKQQQGRRSGRQRDKSAANGTRIWGIHAVYSALQNPRREIRELYLTRNAAQRIGEMSDQPLPLFTEATPKDIDQLIGPDPVHQGALLLAEDLPVRELEDLTGNDCVAVLDQVTDPHNVGAILRSAAAFGVSSLIMTQRHSPHLSGTLAKTASGGLEHVDIILVGNLAQALQKLEGLGYFRIGFDGGGETAMEEISVSRQQGTALVFGAEENGLRRLSRENCDCLCRINAMGAFCSLNVSNAAAIAFHHFLSPSGDKGPVV